MLSRTPSNLASRPLSKSARQSRLSVRAATATPRASKYVIHQIPNNGVWENGVPAVMGAHLMASGFVAPVSVSKGAGLDVYPPEVAYYSKEGDVQVMLHATAGAAANSLAKLVVEASEAAIKAKGSFTLVLSGGSLPGYLAALLTFKGAVQWDKARFTPCIHVPYQHALKLGISPRLACMHRDYRTWTGQ